MSTPANHTAMSAINDAREADGKFGTQPAADMSAATDLGTPAGPAPFGVTLNRQRWDGSYAVEAGSDDFNLAPLLAAQTAEQRKEMLDFLVDHGDANNDIGDELYRDAVSRGLVDDHEGPFYLDVDVDELVAWDQTHPVTPESTSAAQHRFVTSQVTHVAAELAEIRTRESLLAERANRLEVASRILGSDGGVTPGDTVELLHWNDEPGEEGAYAITLATVYNSHGESVGSFIEHTGLDGPLAAGWDGATDFDIFIGDDRRLHVDKVHEWIAGGAR